MTAETGELLLISGARFPLGPEAWEPLRFEENRTKFISVLACRGNDGGLVFLGLDFIGALPERPMRWK